MTVELFNKKGIDTSKLENLYGKEQTNDLVKEIIEENLTIIKNIKNSEAFDTIKENTNGEVDLATSFANIYIETKINQETINALSEELEEQNMEIKHLKNMKECSFERDKRLVELGNKNKEIEQQMQSKRKTKIRTYKK